MAQEIDLHKYRCKKCGEYFWTKYNYDRHKKKDECFGIEQDEKRNKKKKK